MAIENMQFVCLTADAQSFAGDDKSERYSNWCSRIASELTKDSPDFAVLHIQNVKMGAEYADTFCRDLHKKLIEEQKLDEHFEASKSFFDWNDTGLGSFYFVRNLNAHESLKFWNHEKGSYADVRKEHDLYCDSDGMDELICGTFPDDCFSYDLADDDKVSQTDTGYMIAQWKFDDKTLCFVNLCLFSKSKCLQDVGKSGHTTGAAETRKKQLDHVARILNFGSPGEEAIYAGAFNCHLSERTLLDDLVYQTDVSLNKEADENGDLKAVRGYDMNGKRRITVENDRFDLHNDHDWMFELARGQIMRKYDLELKDAQLFEQRIFFPPSRYYNCDEQQTKDTFQRCQCPRWADRILINEACRDALKQDAYHAANLTYGLVGAGCNVGAVKPVALRGVLTTRSDDGDGEAAARRSGFGPLTLGALRAVGRMTETYKHEFGSSERLPRCFARRYDFYQRTSFEQDASPSTSVVRTHAVERH